MPQDSHGLASFEVITPPPKSWVFSGQKKMRFILGFLYMDAHPLLKIRIRQFFLLILFRLFLSKIF